MTAGFDPEERVRAICMSLPEVTEQRAWVGVRWTVRTKNFAHVLDIVDGRPEGHARAVSSDGPLTVMIFRAPPDDIMAFRHLGPPFFKPVWFADVAGVVIDERTDWDEIAEIVTESYCHLAPRKLSALVARPD